MLPSKRRAPMELTGGTLELHSQRPPGGFGPLKRRMIHSGMSAQEVFDARRGFRAERQKLKASPS